MKFYIVVLIDSFEAKWLSNWTVAMYVQISRCDTFIWNATNFKEKGIILRLCAADLLILCISLDINKSYS